MRLRKWVEALEAKIILTEERLEDKIVFWLSQHNRISSDMTDVLKRLDAIERKLNRIDFRG